MPGRGTPRRDARRLLIGALAAILIGSAFVPAWHSGHGLDFKQDCAVCKVEGQSLVVSGGIAPLGVTEATDSAPAVGDLAATSDCLFNQALARAPPASLL